MPKQVIGIGTIAEDDTGDGLRDAMDKTNDNFNELYNYVFQNKTSGDVANTSNTIAVATGLEVEITPSNANTKLIVSYHAEFELATTQNGVQIEYEYSTDNYSTSTTVLASIYVTTPGVVVRVPIDGKVEIPNPGIAIKVRVIFKVQTDTFTATFFGSRGGFMDIMERQ